ncbi:MAG: PspC domain-containing protein [Solirubrobacterales bacterium]
MNDDETTQDPEAHGSQPPTEEAPTREVPPERVGGGGGTRGRRFLRSRDDRVVAGVAGGLGDYFDIDPVIVRIAFAVTVLFGGLGVVAYLAAALFVPTDDGSGNPAPSRRGHGVARGLGVGALVLITIAGFGTLAVGAAFVTGIGYGLVVVGAIVLIGIALIALSFRGGARWLIVPALALSIGAAAAAAADLDLDGGIGKRNYHPSSAAELPSNGYELGVGRIAVDLRDIDWSPTRVVDLDVRLGIGQAVIAVPSDVCVSADVHAGAGNLRIAGEHSEGADVDVSTGEGSDGKPRLVLSADVDLGEIRVINADSTDILDGNRSGEAFQGDDGGSAQANAKACVG